MKAEENLRASNELPQPECCGNCPVYGSVLSILATFSGGSNLTAVGLAGENLISGA
jgi:hypothetical protein